MNHTFKKENGKLTATVTFDEKEIQHATNKAVNRLAKEVTIKGFRKGMAPVEEARKFLNPDDVMNQTVNNLLGNVDGAFEKDDEFQGYVKENKLASGFRPAVNLTKFSDKEAEFVITYFLRPELTKLGEYKGLKIDVKENKVTDEQVEAEIKRLADDNAELVPVEREAKLGDTANIDFTGLLHGKEFDGGAAKAFDLELGSGRFVPGFEEQVVSHKIGDKFDVAVKMPENYPAPLANADVVFKVVLNSLKEKQTPEINDEFATTLTGSYASKDLAELKAKVRANLEKAAADSFRNAKINAYLLQVRDHSEFVISDEVSKQAVEEREAEDRRNIEAQGLSLDEYLKLMNQTKEEYENGLKAVVEAEIKSSLVYNGIAEAEKIEAPTNEDIEKQLGSPINDFIKNFTNYLKAQKMSEEQINNQINAYISQIFASIMTARVQAKVLELNEGKKEAKKADEKAAA